MSPTMTTTGTNETWAQMQKRWMSEFIDEMGGLDNALMTHVVSVEECKSQSDACAAMRQVYQSAKDPVKWHIDSKILPLAAREFLMKSSRTPERCWSSYHGFLFFPPPGGQSGSGNHNVTLLIEPYWGDPDGKYVSIEMGCAHEFKQRQLGNCYYSYTCTKCDYVYKVDSGD